MSDETVTTPGNGRRVQVRAAVRSAFTPAKRQAFLDHLAGCANATRSAAAAGVGISTVYDARRRDPAFAEAWEEAIEAGYATLEALLIERAMLGADGGGGQYAPGDTIVAGPETIDTWLALDLLRMRSARKGVGNDGRGKWPGPRPGRVSEKELADELCRRLDAVEQGKKGSGRPERGARPRRRSPSPCQFGRSPVPRTGPKPPELPPGERGT